MPPTPTEETMHLVSEVHLRISLPVRGGAVHAAQKPGEATQGKSPDVWSQEFYLHFLHPLRTRVVPLREHVILASVLGRTRQLLRARTHLRGLEKLSHCLAVSSQKRLLLL